MIRTISSRVGVATLVAVTLMASVAVVDASAEVNLRLSAGYAQPTGDVGDQLLGPGADFGLSALALVGERGYVGAGIHLTAFSGQSVGPADITDSGGRFAIELLGQYQLTTMASSIRPYVGAAIGYGAIGWEYTDAAALIFDEDDDAIGLLSLTPYVGMDIPVNEKAGFFAEARFSLSAYEDETEQNFGWDLDGGHVFEAIGGVRVSI